MKIPNINFPDFKNLRTPQIHETSTFMGNMEWKDGYMSQFKEITSDEFLKLIGQENSDIAIGDPFETIKVKGDIEFRNEDYKLDSLSLINFEFLGVVSFLGNQDLKLNIGKGITLKNCTFEKPLVFNSCISKDSELNDLDQKQPALRIINGSFILIQISKSVFPFGVDIYAEKEEKLEIDWFESNNNHLTNAGYTFNRVTFISKFEIKNDLIESVGIDFENCVSFCPIGLNSVNSTMISFMKSQSIFHEQISLKNCDTKQLVFWDVKFKESIEAIDVNVENSIILLNSIFQNSFKFVNNLGDVKDYAVSSGLLILNSKFLNGLEFHGKLLGIKKVMISFSDKSSGILDFQGLNIDNIFLKGNNFKNSLFFKECTFAKLNFENFYNRAVISFNNINSNDSFGEKEIIIKNSNLGNTEFYDFNFSIYREIRIINSRLDNIYSFGVEWFEEKQLQVDKEETSILKILSQKREIYRQLKLAAEKQSDKITYLFFKAREIQLHQEVLKNKKNSASLNLKDRMNYWLQKRSDLISINLGYTNNHGQNWIKPVVLLLLITTIPFYPLIFMAADPEIFFWCQDCDFISPMSFFKKFWLYGSIWPSLFNPARRLSDLFPGIDISFALGFWDGFQRIVLAFFIFQIISAFRKFVK